jgi:hypothetical protein
MATTEHPNTVCPEGHVNPAGQRFCGECGKAVADGHDDTATRVGADEDAADTKPTDGSRPRFLRPKILVPLALVAIVAVGGIALLATRDSSPDMHTVGGLLTLTDTDEYWSDGEACEGSGGYDDIREGAQVTVKDENGHVLATSDLLSGVASSDIECDFAFVVADVPDARFYAVEVSHRGEITNSRQEMEDNAWFVGLTLGD